LLLISDGSIGLICIKTIAQSTYLGNWALLAHVIVFRLFIGFTSILIGGYWGKLFKFTPLLGAFEVVLGAFSLGCINIFTPILTACKKGSKLISKNYFK
jgi:hypothetical protein